MRGHRARSRNNISTPRDGNCHLPYPIRSGPGRSFFFPSLSLSLLFSPSLPVSPCRTLHLALSRTRLSRSPPWYDTPPSRGAIASVYSVIREIEPDSRRIAPPLFPPSPPTDLLRFFSRSRTRCRRRLLPLPLALRVRVRETPGKWLSYDRTTPSAPTLRLYTRASRRRQTNRLRKVKVGKNGWSCKLIARSEMMTL